MAEIELDGVEKRFGSFVALPKLDLRIDKGQFVTLLGPSGCGKTTTLRIIAGLEEPDDGKVSLAGRTVFSREGNVLIPPEKRGLGFIFQSYALWPHLKVDRNITLALTEAKLPKAEIARRLAVALDKVKLNGMDGRYPSELSGGQQQRVAVARVIAAKTDIFLMDEPLSNLDAALRGEMRIELKRLHQELGATTVYVTHDQVEALTMSDVIVVMKDGAIQQQGSPYDIYHRPANLFVAEFIGDPRINQFAASVRRSALFTALEFGGMTVELPGPLFGAGDEVLLAVRPEAIELSETFRPNAIEVRIETVQPMGAQTIVHARNDISRFTVLRPGFVQIEVGSPAWLSIPGDKAICFDRASGRNISGAGDGIAGQSQHGQDDERFPGRRAASGRHGVIA